MYAGGVVLVAPPLAWALLVLDRLEVETAAV